MSERKWMETLRRILQVVSPIKGRIIGVILGIMLGVFLLSIGFWKTLLLAVLGTIGYLLGCKADRRESILEFLDRILPTGLR